MMTTEENIRAILECNYAGLKDEIIDTAVKEICELKQESKTGHWIWDIEKTYCKCSECGIGMGHTEYDYCPNCGTKMEQEDE